MHSIPKTGKFFSDKWISDIFFKKINEKVFKI